MSMITSDDESALSNSAIDHAFLSKLVIGIGEVAEITKVATRQIRYWEQKGIITSLTEEEGRNRRYDYPNIKKIILIKELVDEGYTLEKAAEKVNKRIQTLDEAIKKLTM